MSLKAWEVLEDAPIKELFPVLHKEKQILIIGETQSGLLSSNNNTIKYNENADDKPGIYKYYSDVQV